MRNEGFDITQSLDKMNRKILAGLVSGKVTIIDGVGVEVYQKLLGTSIELEEYEASAFLRDEIEKKIDGTVL
jgi:protein-arginine kinase activator protein McsA